eukprot:snap_masked-scaffold_53-processed-gene-1.59-mRNA-1 protein AED:1.00 eAED:1.00 QI:0/0/0/0/1/1/7/0/792
MSILEKYLQEEDESILTDLNETNSTPSAIFSDIVQHQGTLLEDLLGKDFKIIQSMERKETHTHAGTKSKVLSHLKCENKTYFSGEDEFSPEVSPMSDKIDENRSTENLQNGQDDFDKPPVILPNLCKKNADLPLYKSKRVSNVWKVLEHPLIDNGYESERALMKAEENLSINVELLLRIELKKIQIERTRSMGIIQCFVRQFLARKELGVCRMRRRYFQSQNNRRICVFVELARKRMRELKFLKVSCRKMMEEDMYTRTYLKKQRLREKGEQKQLGDEERVMQSLLSLERKWRLQEARYMKIEEDRNKIACNLCRLERRKEEVENTCMLQEEEYTSLLEKQLIFNQENESLLMTQEESQTRSFAIVESRLRSKVIKRICKSKTSNKNEMKLDFSGLGFSDILRVMSRDQKVLNLLERQVDNGFVRIDLSMNRLREFAVLNCFRFLRKLNLKRNKIKEFSFSALSCCCKLLRELILDSNRLENLNGLHLPFLETLSVKRNRLSQYSLQLKNDEENFIFPALKFLILKENQINCIGSEEHLDLFLSMHPLIILIDIRENPISNRFFSIVENLLTPLVHLRHLKTGYTEKLNPSMMLKETRPLFQQSVVLSYIFEKCSYCDYNPEILDLYREKCLRSLFLNSVIDIIVQVEAMWRGYLTRKKLRELLKKTKKHELVLDALEVSNEKPLALEMEKKKCCSEIEPRPIEPSKLTRPLSCRMDVAQRCSTPRSAKSEELFQQDEMVFHEYKAQKVPTKGRISCARRKFKGSSIEQRLRLLERQRRGGRNSLPKVNMQK